MRKLLERCSIKVHRIVFIAVMSLPLYLPLSREAVALQHAFLWDSVNGMQDLGTLGGFSTAFSINNFGQVVGRVEVVVPEPSTMLLLGIGLVGLVGASVRRKFKKLKE